jgi:hypothetical protein
MFTQSFKARVMAFLAVLSLFCVVFPAQPVAAGINGQQLEILTSRRDSTGRLGYKAIQVRFAGTNSRGQLYTHVENSIRLFMINSFQGCGGKVDFWQALLFMI